MGVPIYIKITHTIFANTNLHNSFVFQFAAIKYYNINMTAGEPTLTLTIRLSSSSRFDIGSCGSITPSSTIQHVKDLISQREESGMCASDRQRLIYKGRILSDDTRTLADYGIGTGNDNSGIVLYLVKGGSAAPNTNNTSGNAGANTTSSTNNSVPTPTTQPTNPNASMSSNPFLNFGANNNANNPMASMMNSMMQNSGGGGMPDLAAMQQEIQNNPQMMSEMMNNPMVQSLMNNTDFMTSMMENNPQMRQLMDSNPELRNALQDPELMRRSMEMMRDPSAMQNMMRNQDLAMANIENMPGGFNALRSMYQDVQEPMMDAMASGVSGASGTGSTSNNSGNGGGNGTAGATNEAMPNPWGASPSTANTASGTNQGAAAANPFASMMGSMGGGMPNAPGAANPFANPMGANGPNIEQTLQMMENPIMRQMMDQMMSNPDNMRRMMESNPMLQQMRQTNPQVAAMFDNPDAVSCLFVYFLKIKLTCYPANLHYCPS